MTVFSCQQQQQQRINYDLRIFMTLKALLSLGKEDDDNDDEVERTRVSLDKPRD